MSIKVLISVVDGPSKGAHFELTSGEMIIGRDRCDLALRDKKVSSKHCRISISGSDVLIEDLGSTNGTFMGGYRIDQTPRSIQNLDEFIVGLSRISVAIVEDLKEVKTKSTKSKTIDLFANLTPPPVKVDSSHTPTAPSKSEAEDDFEDPEPGMRTTGIRRIEALIDDEIATLSKWDHPQVKTVQSTSIPTIKVILKKIKGPEGPNFYECSKAISTIGRRNVDIKINDLDSSRLHAQIEIAGGRQAIVKDLASTNGTFLNGKKIESAELKSGDLIQIGQTVLEVSIEDGR